MTLIEGGRGRKNLKAFFTYSEPNKTDWLTSLARWFFYNQFKRKIVEIEPKQVIYSLGEVRFNDHSDAMKKERTTVNIYSRIVHKMRCKNLLTHSNV